jgi:hypothetical protein
MLCSEILEKLPRPPHLPVFRVVQTLTDVFLCIGASGNVEQTLIGFGILHDGRCLPFHGSTTGRLVLLSCFIKSPDRRRKVVID